jgi:hypothetical protein
MWYRKKGTITGAQTLKNKRGWDSMHMSIGRHAFFNERGRKAEGIYRSADQLVRRKGTSHLLLSSP